MFKEIYVRTQDLPKCINLIWDLEEAFEQQLHPKPRPLLDKSIPTLQLIHEILVLALINTNHDNPTH